MVTTTTQSSNPVELKVINLVCLPGKNEKVNLISSGHREVNVIALTMCHIGNRFILSRQFLCSLNSVSFKNLLRSVQILATEISISTLVSLKLKLKKCNKKKIQFLQMIDNLVNDLPDWTIVMNSPEGGGITKPAVLSDNLFNSLKKEALSTIEFYSYKKGGTPKSFVWRF